MTVVVVYDPLYTVVEAVRGQDRFDTDAAKKEYDSSCWLVMADQHD